MTVDLDTRGKEGCKMSGVISKSRRSVITILLAILLVSLLASCNKIPAAVTLDDTNAQAPVAESQEESDPEVFGDPVLPFDDAGKLIGDYSQLNRTRINYPLEYTDSYTVEAYLSEEKDIEAYLEIMNGAEKEFIDLATDSTHNIENVFSEVIFGKSDYYLSMPILDASFLIYIHRTEDCGYLFFNIAKDNISRISDFSLYKISLDTLKDLDVFLGGLEKIENPFIEPTPVEKPVIYLYPENEQDVSVKLDFAGDLLVTYPEYGAGWNVHAYPDGTLTNYTDGLEYSYLYWEGIADDQAWWNISEGYCIPGADTATFLQKALGEFGMTPREYNEFIVYWLPLMQNNPYNLISFQWDEYEAIAPLEITPKPDSMLRVFMVFAPFEEPVDIEAPVEKPKFVRDGFTVVEWGGSKIE